MTAQTPKLTSNSVEEGYVDPIYNPKYVFTGEVLSPQKFEMAGSFRLHLRMLSNVTPDIVSARPLVVMRMPNFFDDKSATTESRVAVALRYHRLEQQLAEISGAEGDVSAVEDGAIKTAQEVISHIRSTALAPPALSSLGTEALVMLWVLGNTKYALTITDGAVGYVVRKGRETVLRKSDLKISDLDVFLLEDKK